MTIEQYDYENNFDFPDKIITLDSIFENLPKGCFLHDKDERDQIKSFYRITPSSRYVYNLDSKYVVKFECRDNYFRKTFGQTQTERELQVWCRLSKSERRYFAPLLYANVGGKIEVSVQKFIDFMDSSCKVISTRQMTVIRNMLLKHNIGDIAWSVEDISKKFYRQYTFETNIDLKSDGVPVIWDWGCVFSSMWYDMENISIT